MVIQKLPKFPMSKLEFVGTKIPPEWIKRLEELSEETKKTRGVILREAIGQYLGLDSDNPDNKRIDPLRSEIEDLKARVTALERKTTLSNSYPVGKEITQLVMDNSVDEVSPSKRALLTGQLHKALELRGYTKKRRTLENSLQKAQKLGSLPDDLAALGVRADFEARAADPRNSALRWLFLDEIEGD